MPTVAMSHVDATVASKLHNIKKRIAYQEIGYEKWVDC